jgi:anti-sigma factor RsiW
MVELVSDYLEGALSRSDRARFERHIAACPHCPAYLEQMRATLRLLGRLEEDSLPPRARDDLLAAFRDWKSAST